MRKIFLGSVCVFALIGGMARAEDARTGDKGWYLGIDGAYSILGGEQAKGSALDLNSHFNDGWAIGGNLGYDFGDWRLEGEIGKHFHSADRFDIRNDGGLGLGGAGNVAATGKSRLTSYMMNLVYDLGRLTDQASVEPFIGAGLGLADMKWRNLATSSTMIADDSDSVFAYQLFAGLRIPLANAFEMSFKYRYLATADATLQDRIGDRFEASYGAHDIILGLTYRFGGAGRKATAELPQPVAVAQRETEPVIAPPAPVSEPVAPDPLPEPAAGPVIDKGPYTVYFDWDSSRITPTAAETLEKAAAEAVKVKDIIIKVAGHADRSGPDGYNDKLSWRRAIMVKNALIEQGVEGPRITIEGFGETMAEVETGDGVREARNRRVVIILE